MSKHAPHDHPFVAYHKERRRQALIGVYALIVFAVVVVLILIMLVKG